MPRTARASVGGQCYHVIDRGNNRMEVFHKPEDHEAFVAMMAKACRRIEASGKKATSVGVGVRVLAYCIMPNYFHLVLWPRGDGDLSRCMQSLLTTHVRRYHRHYQGSGHGRVVLQAFSQTPSRPLPADR